MRYLFLLLQLFFIFSATKLFANAPTFDSSMISDFLSSKTFNDPRSGNLFGNYDQNGIYNASNPGRTYNSGDVLAPVQPRVQDYDKIFQSAENYIKNGGELDPKLFLDEDLNSQMSKSDAENSATLKSLLQQYQNLVNNPELQGNTEENSPEALLQELKKIKEDFQITIYNLYRILKNDPSIINNKLLKDTIAPLRNTEKMEIDKRVGNLYFLFDVLNLMIRHRKYPNLYFESKETIPGDIWGTSISGNGPTITVAAMQNNNSASGSDAKNDESAANPNSDGSAQNDGSAANPDSKNNEQSADAKENENNEENDESGQNSDSDSDANDAGNQPPAANDVVQNDDDGEDGAVEAVRPSNDRIENDDDDDDWIGTGGIVGGVVGAGGIGALMLNSDPIEPQYDDDFYRQPTQKQEVNRVAQDSVTSSDDVITNSDDFDEDERQDSSVVDSQTAAQEAKEQAVQEENNQRDEAEDDVADTSSNEKSVVAKKSSAADDSDNESIADSGYDSDSEDTEADEDEEISEQSKTSARTNQTSRSDRIDQQLLRDQFQGKQSVQRNYASASGQNFERDNDEENAEIPDRNSSQVFTPNNSVEDYIRGSDSSVEDYLRGSDNSVEDYLRGSDNSIEDYIRSETDPYWNENDQYSTISGGLYGRYQLVPTKNDRLRRYKPLDNEMLHADDF
ncbi:MAG: hypothetical protein J6S86_04225 [Alphaproteobacteria bacterium]|nr:hypothetical protein [Alphaproteobacteria bacterium]